jgi:multisubunit Na+/H+ antiporter MnhC subunit
LSVNGLNKTGEDAEEMSVVTVGEKSNLQYGRRLWIPAGSKRQSWLSIEIPAEISESVDPRRQAAGIYTELTTMQLKETSRGEEFKANAVGMPKGKRRLLLSSESYRTGRLISPRLSTQDAEYAAAVISRTLYAASDSQRMGEQDLGMVDLNRGFIPPTSRPLDPLDQLIIADDAILADTVGVRRIRSWLNGGGRLWVMADQISPESVRKLLGDAMCYSVIDEIELNDYQICVRAQHASAQDEFTEMSFDNPIHMRRVSVDTDDIICEVDGWPAAFWKQVGQGEVLFTTLDARGWLSDATISPPLQSVARRFFVSKLEPPVYVAEVSEVLDGEIGYQIPSRKSVAWVLLLQVFAVVIGGIWLMLRKQLQRLAVLVPVSAFAAMIILVAMGKQNTSQVPSTIATGQIVRTTPDSATAGVSSVSAIYSQEERPLPLASNGDSTTHLVGQDGGATERVVWDDAGGARWYFVNQPPGVVQHVETESVVEIDRPWNAVGRFTPDGFEVTMDGLNPDACEDTFVGTLGTPDLSLIEVGEATDGYRGNGILVSGRFISSSVLSEKQQMRQGLLRELSGNEAGFFTAEPALITWTKPLDIGLEFGEGYEKVGWSLVSMPLRFERTPRQTAFKVPSTFVRQGPLLGEIGSSFFNVTTGKWLDDLLKPGQVGVRCVVPQSVMPCELAKATIDLVIKAPGRTVAIRGYVDDEFKTLKEFENPIGAVQFSIVDPQALGLDEEGGLRLGIEVSESTEQRDAAANDDGTSVVKTEPVRNTWGIESLQVSLEGVVK